MHAKIKRYEHILLNKVSDMPTFPEDDHWCARILSRKTTLSHLKLQPWNDGIQLSVVRLVTLL